MERNFEDLDSPLPDGITPIGKLFDIAVKQICSNIEFFDRIECEFADDFSDITVIAHDPCSGIRFIMTIYKNWHICLKANGDGCFINTYPIYQKLFDWGFLQANTK